MQGGRQQGGIGFTDCDSIPLRSSAAVVYLCQRGALMKCTFSDGGNTTGNGDLGQTGAIIKRIIINAGHTGRDIIATGYIFRCHNQCGLILVEKNTGLVVTVIRIVITYPDASQVATEEHKITNMAHITSNGHRGQSATTMKRT